MLRVLHHTEAGPLFERRTARMSEAERVVAPILEDVRARGDAAVLEYARRFDGLQDPASGVPPAEMETAFEALSTQFRAAMEQAAVNIRRFAARQLPSEFRATLADGQQVGQIVRPLSSMGAYIPAGRYPLPSTLLMTVIPAQVAGVRRTVVVSPKPSAEILGAAHYLGVSHLFRLGGAQAIAALAFGTASVPKVDRIVGPGNIYVAAAKKLLAGEVGIDFVAGPTEIVMVFGDGDPAALAADMLAQAEHDVDASAILLTTSPDLARAVASEVERQLRTLPTAAVAGESIARNSAIVITPSLELAMELANRLAPEHLSIESEDLLPLVEHAGSVFIGHDSPEAAGDYATGPNHTLPTGGAARLRGGLSAADFVKVISIQQLSREALRRLAPAITALARAEGLEAHARSVEVRTRA